MRNALLAGLFLIFSVTETAAETQIQVTTEHWPPNNYLSDDGQVIGIATEKVKKMFELAGIEYTIKLYPWARAYHLALTEQNTAVYSIMRSKQRETLFQWICPLVEQQPLYFIHLNSRKDIVLTQLSDVKNYHLSTTRDEFDHQFLLQNGFKEKTHFELTASDQTNLKMLLMKRTDLVISSQGTITQNLIKAGKTIDEVTLALKLETGLENPVCLAFGLKTSKSTVDKLRSALNQLNGQ